MTKLEMALRIIAGASPPRNHWSTFFPDAPRPEQQRSEGESVERYHDRLNTFVRNRACSWLAEYLTDMENGVTFLLGTHKENTS